MSVQALLRATAATLALGLFSCQAMADATVKVSLWEKGEMKMDMSKNMGMGMGMHGNMMMAMMGITVDKATVPAGKVTFNATNDGKDLPHEMLVAPIASADSVLPYNDAKNAVDEEAAKYLGEIEEIEPGKSGALTLDLTPGLYILFCNVPGHYAAGMWTVVKVE